MEKFTKRVIQTQFTTQQLVAEILEENGQKTMVLKTLSQDITFEPSTDFEELAQLFSSIASELSGKNEVLAVTPRQRTPRSDAGRPRFPKAELKVTPVIS